MSRRVVGAIIDAILEIRERGLGKEFLRTHFPKFAAKREAKWAQRAARRAQRQRQPDEAAGEFFTDDKETTVNMNLLIALAGSLLRHALPWATAFLAGMGIQVSDGSSPWITIGLAVGVYVVMQGVSFYRQLKKNRATPPANG